MAVVARLCSEIISIGIKMSIGLYGGLRKINDRTMKAFVAPNQSVNPLVLIDEKRTIEVVSPHNEKIRLTKETMRLCNPAPN